MFILYYTISRLTKFIGNRHFFFFLNISIIIADSVRTTLCSEIPLSYFNLFFFFFFFLPPKKKIKKDITFCEKSDSDHFSIEHYIHSTILGSQGVKRCY